MKTYSHFLYLLMIIAAFFASCIQGPGLFEKEDGAGTDYMMIATDEDGIVTGRFNAASAATQVLNAGGAIAGANVAFPPGALAIDADISIEEGANIVSSGFASELGIGTGVTKRSSSVVISASLQMDASQDFTVSIPVSGSALALSDASYDTMVVFYKVYKASDKSYFIGLIPRADLTVSGENILFKTKYFGSYQLAETDEKITKAVEASTETPIVTMAQEKVLPPVIWTLGTPRFNDEYREAHVHVKISGFEGIEKCAIFVHKRPSLPAFYSDFTTSKDEIGKVATTGETVHYRATSDDAATLYFRFECEDSRGVRSESQFSAALEVPAKAVSGTTPSSGGTTAPVLAFDANFAPSSDPKLRAVDLTTKEITLVGSCDSSLGRISVRVDEIVVGGNASSTTSCVDNRFSLGFVLHSDATCSTGKICAPSGYGGYGVYLSQGSMLAKTVIFKVETTTDTAHFKVVTNKTDLRAAIDDAMIKAHKVIVLGSNIDLADGGPWLPYTFPGSFPLILDGNFHSLDNFSYSNTSAASSIGIFATLGGTGAHRISHLVVNNSRIAFTHPSDVASSIGGLIGDASCSACRLVDISMVTPSITNTSTHASAVTKVGGLVGRLGAGALIFDAFVDHANIDTQAGSYLGGVVGYADGELRSVWAAAPIVKGFNSVGGIVGSSSSTAPVAHADLKVTDAQVSVSPSGSRGSLVYGYLDSMFTATGISASGSIDAGANAIDIGGLCGQGRGNINDAVVSVTVTGGSFVGGILGYQMGGTIQRVKASAKLLSSGTYIGYLAGKINLGVLQYAVLTGGSGPSSLAGGYGSSYTFDYIDYLSTLNSPTTSVFTAGAINVTPASSADLAGIPYTWSSSNRWSPLGYLNIAIYK